MGLSTQSKFICGIISMKRADIYEQSDIEFHLREFFLEQGVMYAFIVHIMDKSEKDPTDFVEPHIHFVAEMSKRARLSSWLSRIAIRCWVNPLAVSIEKPTSIDKCIKYLIHKENPEKYQYAVDSIRTNLSTEELETYLNSDGVTIDVDYLLHVVEDSNTLADVARTIGLYYYQRYRPTINDFWRLYHGRKEVDAKCTQ